ncbi:low-density lipoprotein receptor domain class A domain-containing protein [Ditylenchus destructor]|nr:low-density lipoprotein receptor domain class A domain-containing protein [Ditylenchus destructor]
MPDAIYQGKRLKSTDNDRISILPPPGSPLSELTLTNSSSSPSLLQSTSIDVLTCAIRLEACTNCLISMELESPMAYFTEFQMEKFSKCDDPTATPNEPCFNLWVVEERADRPLSIHIPTNIDTYLSKDASVPGHESPFYTKVSVWDHFRGGTRWFNSSSSSVLVMAVMKNMESDVQLWKFIQRLFPIKISVQDNSEAIEGRPSESILMHQLAAGFIQSPRFPEPYPRILTKNYTLVNKDLSGFVRLIFDDFHIHYLSELKILDSDEQELFSTKREHRRPPSLISSGNKMSVIFTAKDFSQVVGFRAHYEFVQSRSWPDQPSPKNCDEYLESYGGRITLDGQKHLLNTYVDCIWLIGRFPSISRTFDRIYLKVDEFGLRGSGLRLEIRRGTNSGAERVFLLFDQQLRGENWSQKQPPEGFQADDVQPAFYMRLRGYLTYNQGFSVTFAHFYRWATALCPGPGEFHCDNSKCVKSVLRCDGYNHCGDSSDEICNMPELVLEVEAYNVPSLLTLIIGMISIFLILFMIIALASTMTRNQLFFNLDRLTHRNQREANNTSSPDAIAQNSEISVRQNSNDVSSQLLNIGRQQTAPCIQTIGERRFYVLPPMDQINMIEAPPTYDDALKHPTVPSNERAMQMGYTNGAFRASLPDIVVEDHSTSTICPTNESMTANELEESSSESENVTEIELAQCNANNLSARSNLSQTDVDIISRLPSPTDIQAHVHSPQFETWPGSICLPKRPGTADGFRRTDFENRKYLTNENRSRSWASKINDRNKYEQITKLLTNLPHTIAQRSRVEDENKYNAKVPNQPGRTSQRNESWV